MAVYTVHAPIEPGDTTPRQRDKFVFIRDGFHFWAMVLTLPWLLFHQLWIVTLVYIVFSLALDFGLVALGVDSGTIFAVMALVALLMGFEASTLRRWTYSRGKWRQLDLVVADHEDAAEQRFFDRWAGRRDLADERGGIDRGAPPPPRYASPAQSHPASPDGPNSVLGLFPQPGALR